MLDIINTCLNINKQLNMTTTQKKETMFDELRRATVNNWYRCTVGTHFIHVRDVHSPVGVDLCYDVYFADGQRGTSENPLELRDLNEYRRLEKLSDAEVEELKAKIVHAQTSPSCKPGGILATGIRDRISLAELNLNP
jgi:hypothetical protein